MELDPRESNPHPPALARPPDGLTEQEQKIFAWLVRKYVQRQDARQKEMRLQYTTAETSDLAIQIGLAIARGEFNLR